MLDVGIVAFKVYQMASIDSFWIATRLVASGTRKRRLIHDGL
jgi:hypothetical protein